MISIFDEKIKISFIFGRPLHMFRNMRRKDSDVMDARLDTGGVAWKRGSRDADFLSSLQINCTSSDHHSIQATIAETFQNSWHGDDYTHNFSPIGLPSFKDNTYLNSSARLNGARTRVLRVRRALCYVKDSFSAKMSSASDIIAPSLWNSLKERLGGSMATSRASSVDGSMENLNEFEFKKPIVTVYTFEGKDRKPLISNTPFLQPLKEADVWNNICDLFWRPGLSFCPYEWGVNRTVEWRDLWMKGGGLKGLLIDAYCQTSLGVNEEGSSLNEEEQSDRELLELIKLVLRCGPVRVIKYLLALNIIDLNMTIGESGGLLHIACIARNVDVLVFLCAVGVDPRIKDYKGRTAGQLSFTAEIRRHFPAAHLNASLPPVVPPRVCGMSEKRSMFDMAKDPHQLDELFIKLQTVLFDVNKETNDEGDNLIHVTAKQGVKQTALLMSLVKRHRADVNKVSAQGYTPLMLAVLAANDVTAQLLICVLGADPNITEPSTGYTACHLATHYNYYDVLSSLVKRGADINIEGQDGRRPDDVAMVTSGYECLEIIQQERQIRISNIRDKIIQDILAPKDLRGTDLITTDDNDETLLVLAVKHNSIKSIETLLSFRDTPRNAQIPMTGQTALMIAAFFGYAEAAKLLISGGCDARIKDMDGLLAIHHAVRGSHLACVSTILTAHNPPLLGLQKAMNLTDCPKMKSILQQAKLRRQVEIVRPVLWESAVSGDAAALYSILEDGDDVYAGASPQSENPIFLAASNGHLDVLKLLLEHGGDVMGCYGNASSTLLHVACQYGHYGIANHVLNIYRSTLTVSDRLGLVNTCNRYGKTALQLAADTGKASLVALLIQEGASTALVDDTGMLYQCTSYEGIQYMIETARRFHTAAVTNAIVAKRLETLQQIWMPKLDHNLRDPQGNTPLMIACKQGAAFMPIIKFLLSSAVFSLSDDQPIPCGSTVKSRTDKLGKDTKVKVPIEPSNGGSVDSAFELDEGIIEDQDNLQAYNDTEAAVYNEKGTTLYHGDSRIRSLLHSINVAQTAIFQPGGRVSHVCAQNLRDGQTALHYAVRLPDGVAVAVVLLNSDNSVLNMSDHSGYTALHLACKLNKSSMVNLLLAQAEMDVNARTLDGQLPEELTTQPAIIKALQSARCPPPVSSPFLLADQASRAGSLSGASVDFETLNTRFQLVKRRQQHVPPSYKP